MTVLLLVATAGVNSRLPARNGAVWDGCRRFVRPAVSRKLAPPAALEDMAGLPAGGPARSRRGRGASAPAGPARFISACPAAAPGAPARRLDENKVAAAAGRRRKTQSVAPSPGDGASGRGRQRGGEGREARADGSAPRERPSLGAGRRGQLVNTSVCRDSVLAKAASLTIVIPRPNFRVKPLVSSLA